VYGIIRLINFAHGDLIMVGGYVAYFCIIGLKMTLAPALVASMAACAAAGVIIDRVAYRPLRDKPRLKALITAMGVSLLVENGARLLPFIGPSFRRFPDVIPLQRFSLGRGLAVTNIQVLNVAIAVFLMLVLQYLVRHTVIGMAMRAVSLDRKAAALMGISVEGVIMFTFAVGGALAGAAGILMAVTYPRLSPYMGVVPGLKAFVAAVLGGIGSVPGAVLGGLLMGVVETVATSINSQIAEGVFFVLLVVVLLFRPAGLLGKARMEKV
ncbi:MAG: branched-chain amino acid ABC transporter permease, partial [Ignavibacteriales bacterium]